MTEQEVKEKFDELYSKYQHTMEMLVDALDSIDKLKKELDKKPKEVIIEKEVSIEVPVEVIKEVEVEVIKEVEKIVEVEVPVEVIKEVIVTKEIEVEKVVEVKVEVPVEKETVVTVEKEVPGPERIVEVPGPERIVNVPGPERIVEKIVEVERVVEVPVTEFVDQPPQVIETASTKDLHEAARLMAQSEFNKEDLSEKQIYNLLVKESEDEVKRKIGFWAMPLPTADTEPTNKKYTGKKR